jgi:cytochrome c peroxidase
MSRQRSIEVCLLVVGALWLLACGGDAETPAEVVPVAEAPAEATAPAEAHDVMLAATRGRAQQLLGVLPAEASSDSNPVTEEKITLGRMLYYDARLSKNHDISCNSCHQLDNAGVDSEPTSPGHQGQRGGRNSPTVYNAALHLSQFWDGREPDVEAQAKGPVLNPIEMAMPSEAAVVGVLKSIPGYAPLFAAAFPESDDPITYDNMARAIGAFERRLITPGRLDAFIQGDDAALTSEELAGLDRFLLAGCTTCHRGAAIGGGLYQKIGLLKPYATDDPGRQAITGNDADLHKFKVPSLRNVARTGPYFHDGSIATLEQVVRLMGEHQLGRTLPDEEVAAILVFLAALGADVDPAYIAMPELPASGPDTPAPDPS